MKVLLLYHANQKHEGKLRVRKKTKNNNDPENIHHSEARRELQKQNYFCIYKRNECCEMINNQRT